MEAFFGGFGSLKWFLYEALSVRQVYAPNAQRLINKFIIESFFDSVEVR